ncbi:MAG: aminotransferase class V-fold PLP-dependent enzyme [Verrucomicrobiia bacterium]
MTPITLHNLLRDDKLRRHEFPVCEKKIFLAHAGVSPLPRRVTEAMQRYLDAAARDDQEDALPERIIGETRQLAAKLIGASAEEIAFVGSTSMGLAMVATGLAWQNGDNLVCYRDDYPANVYPWMDLERRGVQLRFVEPKQYGNVTVEDLEPIVDGRTRLVALASTHFLSGWRLGVDRIGQFLKKKGVLFCLDGIQSFGALHTTVQHVDFAAADAHKWLLGPLGIAILYVRKEQFEHLHPPLVGWRNAICPDYVTQEKLTFWPDARRYEPGSLNLTGLVGLHAALEMILEFGIEAIERRVIKLAKQVVAEAQQRGFEVLGPKLDNKWMSGIVTLLSKRHDLERLHAELMRANVITSLRCRRGGVRCLRVSAHFYSREEEIERLISQV